MPALTDAEILAALPVEARQKIDNAFEALSQSLPSDKERIILYRVASTLKLNPTDTHFSVMAALHYYLQLYQEIPDKIEKASNEKLKDYANALKNTAEHEMAKARDTVIGELSKKVGDIAQRLAGDAAAAERNKALGWATVAVIVGMLVVGVAGGIVSNSANSLSNNQIRKEAAATMEAADKSAKAAEATAQEEINTMRKNIGWPGTEEGKLAKKFFDSGEGIKAAKCTGESWEIRDTNEGKYCVPKRRPLIGGDEKEYGWKIP